MALEIAAQHDLKLTFEATLPVKTLPRFSSEQLLVAVNVILMDTGARVELEPELTPAEDISDEARVWHRPKTPPRAGLTVNGVTIQVEGCDRPAYDCSGMAQLDMRSWPDGLERFTRAPAHVRITEVWTIGGSDFDHNCDRAAALTVVAEAVSQLTEAIGVVWHSSGCAIPIDKLSPMFTALTEEQPPLQLWLGCSDREGSATSTTTRGLYPMLGAEVEITSTELAQDIAFEVALDVAAEIFRTGRPPARGAQLEFDKKSAFSVDYKAGNRKSGNEGVVPKVVLTHVMMPIDSKVTVGVA